MAGMDTRQCAAGRRRSATLAQIAVGLDAAVDTAGASGRAASTLTSQPTCLKLLDYYAEWLRPVVESAVNGPSTSLMPPAVRKRLAAASSAKSATGVPKLLSAVDGQWLFALLIVVPDLLEADELSTLRTIARVCRSAAVHLATLPASANAAEEALSLEQSASCWQVVAAVASVWGQSDLWNAT